MSDTPVLLIQGNADTLLKTIYNAAQNDEPIRGIEVHLDDKEILRTSIELGFATQDDVTNILGVTTAGRTFIGIKPEGVVDLPVDVAEITGNVEETELLARYVEGKIKAIDMSLAKREAPQHMLNFSWEESYQHCALTLKALTDEVRMSLHIPTIIFEGRVIPYNEDRSSGVSHKSAVDMMVTDIHGHNVKAGWWHDINTGEPLDRNPYELISLCHSELSEAVEGLRKSRMDDHLPHRKMEEVEMADCVIRIADYCGGRGLDLGGAIDEKLAYNAKRLDHKIENRLKEDGKKA